MLPLLVLAWAPAPAGATELVWDGFFRSRARYFNSLSLSDTNTYAEGASFGLDNRLRLQPGWLLSDHVAIYTQLDLLAGLPWGDSAVATDPVSGDDLPVVYSQSVTPPTTEDGGATLQNIQATRAWAEITSKIGRVRFGRMPVEWGSGMVWNAGNDPLSEFGDTADRLQITSRVGPLYLFGAFELPYEGYVNDKDDLSGLVGGLVYQTETASLGAYNTYRWRNNPDSGEKFGAYIGDIWAWSQLGPAEVEAEFAAVIGSGDLDESTNDVGISSFGANLSLKLPLEHLRLGLQTGFAGGDKDPDDDKIHTFSFDPDFNVGLLLFEEPMPTLAATSANSTNSGRNYDAVQTVDGISNAVFLHPSVGWKFSDAFHADLSLLAAQHAKIPDLDKAKKLSGYGLEIDADLTYKPFEFFALQGTAGMLLPGRTFREYEDDTLGSGFDQPAFGVRLLGTASF